MNRRRSGPAPVALLLAAVLLAGLTPAAHAARRRGPVDGTVTVDGARAATATITAAAGGTIAVTAANGTRIVVSFPAGAVLEDTPVTAVPVARLASRVTRKGLLAGVQLQPEGLQLAQSATVRFIRRGRAPRGTRMVFVGSQGTGRSVHRLPPPVRVRGRGRARRLVATKAPAVAIQHFSTTDAFDWTTATIAEMNAITWPAIGVDRLSQQITAMIEAGEPLIDIIAVLERGRARLLAPIVAAATSKLTSTCSEPSIRYAIGVSRTVTSFERSVQIIGGEDAPDNPVALTAKLLDLTARCMTKLCPTLGDPRAGPYFIRLARQMDLLGAGSDALNDALIENMVRCGTFEVHLDARGDHDAPGEFSYSMRVDGRVTYVPSLTGDPPRPRGPLTYVSTSGSGPGACHTTEISATKPGEFQLADVQLTDYDPERPTRDPVRSVKLTVTRQPLETYHYRSTPTVFDCPVEGPPDYDAALWALGFQSHHPDSTFPGRDFARDTAPRFALAVYSPNTIQLVNGTLSENTLVELIHKPGTPVPLPAAD